ncbi:MBL fold metallo-hydrolase [bacterium]|nr:MBL fold metallo-hydrolase [bacterium]
MEEEYLIAKAPNPQFFKKQMGDVELIAISDGGLNYDIDMILGRIPQDQVSQYNFPEKQIFLPYTILLIKTKDTLLLCDVGAGEFGNNGDKFFPGLDHTTSRTNLVVPSLKLAGIQPEDIDLILITHAHPDHITGMLDAEGNLVFPNARYLTAQNEWDYWMSVDPSAVEAEALRKHLEALVHEARTGFNPIRDKITFVQNGEEILPGIRVEAAYGHTPGHVMVSITSIGQTAYNISDVVVHPLFVEHPEWAPAIDMNWDQADQTRRQFYAKAADENALVFGHHMGPFPNFGRIVKQGSSFQWQAIEKDG